MLRIFGLPARLIGGGSCDGVPAFSGSILARAPVAAFKSGAGAGTGLDPAAGESGLLRAGRRNGDPERDKLRAPFSSCPSGSERGVIRPYCADFGGDRGDSTFTVGGDRGGESGPIDIGRGLDELRERDSDAMLSFPNDFCARRRPSRAGDSLRSIGRGTSNENRPSGRDLAASCPSCGNGLLGDGCLGVPAPGPLVGEGAFMPKFSKRLRREETVCCMVVSQVGTQPQYPWRERELTGELSSAFFSSLFSIFSPVSCPSSIGWPDVARCKMARSYNARAMNSGLTTSGFPMATRASPMLFCV